MMASNCVPGSGLLFKTDSMFRANLACWSVVNEISDKPAVNESTNFVTVGRDGFVERAAIARSLINCCFWSGVAGDPVFKLTRSVRILAMLCDCETAGVVAAGLV